MIACQRAVRLTPWVDDPTWSDLRIRVCAWLWARNQGMRVVLGSGAGAMFRNKARWLGLDWDDVAPSWHDLDDACLEVARHMLTQGSARLAQFTTGEIIWWRAELVDQSAVVWDDLVLGPCTQSTGPAWGLYAGLTPDLAGGRPGPELLALLADRTSGVTHLLGSAGGFDTSARYLRIARALGTDRPCLAHLPVEPDDPGVNLSKLERAGYLGPAVAAYAATMGWAAQRQNVGLTLDELASRFSLMDAAKPPSRFDPQRLLTFNRECARRQSHDASSSD